MQRTSEIWKYKIGLLFETSNISCLKKIKMSPWLSLLQKPKNLRDKGIAQDWFTEIANNLLNGSDLIVGNQTHRIIEIEFYCFAPEHPDYFAHRDPLQKECGSWYFHRSGGKYKSGSFKGLDLTFGDGEMFCGVLFRTIESSTGKLICGPSLCVDYLLASSDRDDVKSLDEAMSGRKAWDYQNPVFLRKKDMQEENQIFRSGRVGLTLRKAKSFPSLTEYILKPYRYFVEPRKVSKGKPYIVLSMYLQGLSPEDIKQNTGSPNSSIERYINDFEVGKQEEDFSPYFVKNLNTKALCKLHGTWYQNFLSNE